ncbi:MAG: hypothetical protein RIB03_12835 [Henriciella sp.]|uniref:hypothetical protein n=1 Tax=Henriciella sp. TaxID=1968823 RepID=UPI0032F0834F
MVAIFKSVILFVFASAIAAGASAQLAIDKLWIDFDEQRDTRGDLLLANESDERYYISVDPVEIVNPGTDEEERVSYADPEELGLLVTPNRLILDPGQSRSLRVIRISGDMSRDRVYRVRIEPKVGEIRAEGFEAERAMVLKILTAYEVLVTSRPLNPSYELDSSRTEDAITLSNAGNSNALVYDAYLCPAGKEPGADDAACNKVSTRRLHPGNQWKIPIEEKSLQLHAKVKLRANDEEKSVVF